MSRKQWRRTGRALDAFLQTLDDNVPHMTNPLSRGRPGVAFFTGPTAPKEKKKTKKSKKKEKKKKKKKKEKETEEMKTMKMAETERGGDTNRPLASRTTPDWIRGTCARSAGEDSSSLAETPQRDK